MLGRPFLALGLLLCGLSFVEFLFAAADATVSDENWQGFLLAAVISGLLGGGCVGAFWTAASDKRFDLRSGFVLTALCWTVIPLMASLPFLFSNLGMSFTDAVFETISGITTTGSTVLTGLDHLDPMLLLWRSALQWIGGVGIILMAIIMMPFLRIGGMQLFQLESSTRTEASLHARPLALINSIAALYLTLTLLCTAAYALAGMSTFDAINHAMTTLSTGGYSTHDASLGFFNSTAVSWAAIIFMTAGALPFMAYLKSFSGEPRAFLRDPQAIPFLAFLLAVSAAGALLLSDEGGGDAFTRVALHVVSIVTTTGFASEDYQYWGAGFIGLFFALTFIGGCAGSTSGAIKIYRFQLLGIYAAAHLRRLHSPSIVQATSYGGMKLDREIGLSVLAFLSLFVGAFSVGGFALSLTGLDFVTAMSASATALCNVGPGLGEIIGPAGNFASVSDMAKWILLGLMLLGRLELFALLVLLDPYFWR
ncbi:TrkH family potassium uptake protein [Hyphococcus luteus]|uniref:Trk system potassium uptake protein n=1 Tax=Hyphococcus luteus TaxID=2058213 RepID=A0A2S7K6R5_9PROT|nr:TrkH family potassium uptake protein [Marinicaulis flavus]PQA88182.1 potassium transporter TrkH [Marinicaulis flavus]